MIQMLGNNADNITGTSWEYYWDAPLVEVRAEFNIN